MEKRPSRLELIKLLIVERNHHFAHPQAVSVKLFYSMGGTITTLLKALFLKKDAFNNFEEFINADSNLSFFIVFGASPIVGYIFIFGA